MKRYKDFIALIILLITVTFNLYLYFPETKILSDPNDNIFQYSLVNRTNWIWENYNCPLSLNCLPNLIDHLVPNWAEGYPLPFYYTHVPQIAIVSSYHLLVKPLFSQLNMTYSLYQYYNLTKYLLLALLPIPIFIALRMVSFASIISALTAFTAAHFSTDGLYGIDPPSFLWRGYGLTSQLYAIFFMPLGLAFTYSSLKKNKSLLWAIVFLTFTTMGHLGMGIIGLLSTLPFIFLDLTWINIKSRIIKLTKIYLGVILILSYWIIPILLNNNYHLISFWDPIWKFNSYGWYEVTRQFLQGEIFDWQRFPVITILVVIGLLNIILDRNLFIFGLLFVFWFFMYFGRTTWGGLIDLIPGMKDFHLHRFIVGIQIASLFLIPKAWDYIFSILKSSINYIIEKILLLQFILTKTKYFSKKLTFSKDELLRNKNHDNSTLSIIQNVTFYIISLITISLIAIYTVKQTNSYARLNNKWIGEANIAYKYDEKNFIDLLKYLDQLPNARVYAGRPGNWGKKMRLGSTEVYMLIGVNGYDLSQFLPETWSPMSENDQNFDERTAADYDLLNIKYIVASKNEGFATSAVLDKKFGPYELYKIPTMGWFDVVTSPMYVKSDKTNFSNTVTLWHKSYARLWKMHPILSVEKNSTIPPNMKRVLYMQDEVTYREENTSKNIFNDFPFTFPQATVSAQIVKETVNKQTYQVSVDVPTLCDACALMFKMSYHPDWVAKVDGRVADKFAVFPFFLAVNLSPGTHNVEFTYQPNKLKVIILYLEITVLLIIFFRKIIPIVRRFAPFMSVKTS